MDKKYEVSRILLEYDYTNCDGEDAILNQQREEIEDIIKKDVYLCKKSQEYVQKFCNLIVFCAFIAKRTKIKMTVDISDGEDIGSVFLYSPILLGDSKSILICMINICNLCDQIYVLGNVGNTVVIGFDCSLSDETKAITNNKTP